MNIFKKKINDWPTIINNLKIIVVVIVLYAVIWVAIIFNFYVEYSENFFQTRDVATKTIGLSVQDLRMGENFLADRLVVAADKLGWRAYKIKYMKMMDSMVLYNFPLILTDLLLYMKYKPDYTISVSEHSKHSPFGQKFLFLNIPFAWFNDQGNGFVKDYDAYIDVNRFGSDASLYDDFLIRVNKGQKKKVLGLVVPVQEYQYKQCEPKNLVIFGSRTGKGRVSAKYTKFFELLADSGYSYFYGPGYDWRPLGVAYKGSLEKEYNLIEAINSGCIGLVIHSHTHIEAGIPTTRVMEVAAASANIISDKNPFVEKYFGDSALYFDQDASAKEMFTQVDEHVKYLIANKDKAKEMAKKSYDIFKNNYTAERFLLEIDRHLAR
jgi:hypothetical protein